MSLKLRSEHTHTLSSSFAVQPCLAEDSCLQLSVITFYLLQRYLWMWAKPLHSDPLSFYHLQDEIRGRVLKRTGSAASVGHIPCLRPDTESISRSIGGCCTHLGESHLQMYALQFALQLSGKEPQGYGEAQGKCIICTTPSMFLQCQPSLAPRQS